MREEGGYRSHDREKRLVLRSRGYACAALWLGLSRFAVEDTFDYSPPSHRSFTHISGVRFLKPGVAYRSSNARPSVASSSRSRRSHGVSEASGSASNTLARRRAPWKPSRLSTAIELE